MDPNQPRHPMALAMEWVARITVIGAVMVLPGVLGHWLDGRFGTGYLAPLGFLVGLVVGMACLLAVTKAQEKKRRK